jgi:hypothetical protein
MQLVENNGSDALHSNAILHFNGDDKPWLLPSTANKQAASLIANLWTRYAVAPPPRALTE